MGNIMNRNPSWEREDSIKRVLSDIQRLMQIRELFEAENQFDALIYFVLDQFPVSEGYLQNGEVVDAWSEFENGIPGYSLDEFYDRTMHPEKYRHG